MDPMDDQGVESASVTMNPKPYFLNSLPRILDPKP